MKMTTTYAGMDAHAATIRVAVLAAEGGRPEEWQLTNEPRSVKRLAQRLKRMAPGPVVACYEAGPGGFALQRQLEAAGHRMPGDRAGADPQAARRPRQDRPPRRQEARRAAARGPAHGGASSDHRPGGGARPLPGARGRRDRPHAGAPPPGEAAAAARHRLRRAELDAAAPPLAADVALRTPGRAGHLRRLPACARGRGGAAAHAGAGTGRVCRQRRLPRGGGAAALLPRGRHGDGADGARRARRRHALRQRPAVDVLPRAHAQRVQQRRPSAAGTDHEDRATATCAASWWRAPGTTATRRASAGSSASAARASRAGPWCWPTGRRPGSIAATGGWPFTASHRWWRTWPSPVNSRATCGRCCGVSPHPREGRRSAPGSRRRPDSRRVVRGEGGAGDTPLRSRRGWMSEGRLRRTRGTAMRQRRPAPSTRDPRRRPLPAKHGHAARPQATREYQSDTSSKQRPRSSISPRSGAGSPRPPAVLIDNRSLHISCSSRRARAVSRAPA